MPAVSVILLAWNSGRLLQGAVDSVLDQTMRDVELIIVDNGSTDGAVEQVLARRPDPRVKVLRHAENLGIGAGTASAVALCTAPWIALMDSDDESHPMRFELQLKAAEADPSLHLISTDVELIDANGAVAGVWPAFFVAAEMKPYAAYHMPFCHPTLMARANVFRSVPYRAEFNITADFDFVARASEQFKFGAVSLPLYRYRRHASATSIERSTLSEAYACGIRLITARRNAGRAERVKEEVAQARELIADGAALADVFRCWSRRCQREGFPLLGALHAALEIRERCTLGAMTRYLRCTFAAQKAQRVSWTATAAAMIKAPFWMLLKDAGFPAFPRY